MEWAVLATGIGGVLAGAATVWQIIRKTPTEVASIEVQNAEATIRGVYEPIIARLRTEMDELRQACLADKTRLADLRSHLTSEREALRRVQEKFDEMIEGEVLRQLVIDIIKDYRDEAEHGG